MISTRLAAFLVSRAEIGRKIADQDAETRRLRARHAAQSAEWDEAFELDVGENRRLKIANVGLRHELEAERARTADLTAALRRLDERTRR